MVPRCSWCAGCACRAATRHILRGVDALRGAWRDRRADGPVGVGKDHHPALGCGAGALRCRHGGRRWHHAVWRDVAGRHGARCTARSAWSFSSISCSSTCRRSTTSAWRQCMCTRWGGCRPRPAPGNCSSTSGWATAPRRFPRELSGGEAQRTAIARALAVDPPLLLLDEPTASLDPARCRELGETLQTLASEGRTLVMTSHDDEFVAEFATRVVVLADGCVVEAGVPRDVLSHPQHDATRALLSVKGHEKKR